MKNQKCTLSVDGMHCASCEVLIEKKLKKINGINSVEANLNTHQVEIETNGDDLDIKEINRIFEENGYVFYTQKKIVNEAKLFSVIDGKLIINRQKGGVFFKGIGITLIILIALFYIENSKLGQYASISETSSLGSFFVFGIIAGLSSCAALVGGLLLSLSKQWSELYIHEDGGFKRAFPFIMFNVGRLLSFAVFGGLLGLLGQMLGLSATANPIVTGVLIILVSVYMLLLGLNMLGVNYIEKFNFKIPRFISSKISDEENFKGKLMPFIVGALTFLLPCGFTLNVQAIALTSGSPIWGGLMLLAFALGTLPMLVLISFTSVKLAQKPKLNAMFNIVAGILVVLFALYNLNSQLNVLGLPSLTDLKLLNITTENTYTSEIKDGIQVLQTTATSDGYYPVNAVVKAGVPIVWKIKDEGATGCTNSIISPSLFGNTQVSLMQGDNTVQVRELSVGTYKYTCSMGMYSGVIQVIP
jgi:sulfite exporter TauE/SafE/copper chaperone CopZ